MESTEDLKAIMGNKLSQKERDELRNKLKWPAKRMFDGQQFVVIPFAMVGIQGELLDAVNSALHDVHRFTCIRFKLHNMLDEDHVQFKAGKKG